MSQELTTPSTAQLSPHRSPVKEEFLEVRTFINDITHASYTSNNAMNYIALEAKCSINSIFPLIKLKIYYIKIFNVQIDTYHLM